MEAVVNVSRIAPESVGRNATRQPLITPERARGSNIRLERLAIGAGGEAALDAPADGFAWFFVLDGVAALTRAGGHDDLGPTHVGFLPPAFAGPISSTHGASLLLARVPAAARFDPAFATTPPALKIVDWTREPVLDSAHDARKRIYVATPKMFGTRALKAEMIAYPENTSGSNHHHEGAEHFKYVLEGAGTGFSNETPHRLVAGDMLWHPEGERHYSVTGPGESMRFIEFFVPGGYSTVWQDEKRVCTWQPTGKDSRGGRPVRAIAGHSSALTAAPEDV